MIIHHVIVNLSSSSLDCSHFFYQKQQTFKTLRTGVQIRLASILNSLVKRFCSTPATFLAIPGQATDANDVHLRDLKQRTPDWYTCRNDGSFSSSQFSVGLGYHGLKGAEAVQKEAWSKVSQLPQFKRLWF